MLLCVGGKLSASEKDVTFPCLTSGNGGEGDEEFSNWVFLYLNYSVNKINVVTRHVMINMTHTHTQVFRFPK